MKRLIITGADGFIGKALVQHFVADHRFSVTPLRRRGEHGPGSRHGILGPLELTDGAAVEDRLRRLEPDVIVHAAGRTSGTPECLARDNVVATETLIEAVAVAAPDAHVVLLGSAAEYGERSDETAFKESDRCLPTSSYGFAKLAATERARREFGHLPIAVLRIFNLLSVDPESRQVLGTFLARARAALAGGQSRVEMGSLGAIRDFVTMADLTKSVEQAIFRAVIGEVVNVCSGRPVEVRKLVEEARTLLNLPVQVNETPPGVTAGRSSCVGDPAKCRTLLGFVPAGSLGSVLRLPGTAEPGEKTTVASRGYQ